MSEANLLLLISQILCSVFKLSEAHLFASQRLFCPEVSRGIAIAVTIGYVMVDVKL